MCGWALKFQARVVNNYNSYLFLLVDHASEAMEEAIAERVKLTQTPYRARAKLWTQYLGPLVAPLLVQWSTKTLTQIHGFDIIFLERNTLESVKNRTLNIDGGVAQLVRAQDS